jgi:probable HAF family extracellular repeat protein
MMKITRSFKVGGFFLAATFSAGLGFGTIASAQVTHSYLVDLNRKTVTDIGTLDGTDLSTDARGINDAGRVVGSSGIGSIFGVFQAFITGPDGMGMRDLGTLGGAHSFADGISEAGQVTGSSYTAGDATIHAFITGTNGTGMRDLGTLGGTASRASGINAAGQVVGYSSTAEGPFHAFITGPDGMGMRDLGTT